MNPLILPPFYFYNLDTLFFGQNFLCAIELAIQYNSSTTWMRNATRPARKDQHSRLGASVKLILVSEPGKVGCGSCEFRWREWKYQKDFVVGTEYDVDGL